MRNRFQMDDPYLSIFRDQTPISNSLPLYQRIDSQMDGIKVQQNHFEQEDMRLQKNSQKNSNKAKNSKSNKKSKIFYREKMAMLSEDMALKNQEYNYVEYSKSGRCKSPISRQQQLKRNRQSAKLSRQRKKQYLQLLEEKNAEKDKLIEQLSLRLKKSQYQREKLKQIDITTRRNFLLLISDATEKLNQMTNSPLYTDQQVSNFIDESIRQYGAAGEQRVSTTTIYLKEVIELLLADVHKYLLNCVFNNKGLIGLGKWEPIDQQIASNLGITKDKRGYFCSKYSERLKREGQAFRNLSQQLYQTYQSIQNQSRVIENIFNEIRGQFSGKSLGKALVWFQQNKFRKQIKRLRSYWMDTLDKEEVTDNIRKQQKLSNPFNTDF